MPGSIGAIETFEDARQMIFGNTYASINHKDFGGLGIAYRYHSNTTLTCIFDRVTNQVHKQS